MKSFAERLVARGAGQPTGLPLLTPRPAARFEREMAAPAEAEIPVGSPAETTPSAAPASRRSPTSVPANHPAKTSPAHPGEQRDVAATKNAMPSPDQTEVPPLAPVTMPLSPGPSVQSVATVAMPERSARQEASAGEAEFPARQPPLFFDEPHPVRVTQSAPSIASETPAPAISIGRIEVQFLPQEKPAAPQRPEPQRTRGFEAYSRARRGLPR